MLIEGPEPMQSSRSIVEQDLAENRNISSGSPTTANCQILPELGASLRSGG
jgi:hypothetical protein